MSERRIATFVDREGKPARVGYRRIGRGSPVLLIHGVGMQADVWRPQIDALSVRHDVIAVDMLGHGETSLPPVDARLRDYADAILALLDSLDLGRAHIVGHSMGALVALEAALNHSGRFISLVALNAVFRRTQAQRAAVEARARAVESGGAVTDLPATIARWFGDPAPASQREAMAEITGFLRSVNPIGYQRTYRLFASSDEAHASRLETLPLPALFMTGEMDLNSDPAMSAAMASLVPRGNVEIIPAARHMMAVTSPREVNDRLLAFLAKMDAGNPSSIVASEGQAERSFNAKTFRNALGTFPTGVTVVATLQEDATPRGFTANSFSSVSLDPPLISICIAKTASSFPVFSEAERFSVNILANDQTAVSNLFASKRADKFGQATWRKGVSGSPILDGVSAWFECRRHGIVEAGDHVILLGEVLAFDQHAANPLVYCRGSYVEVAFDAGAVAASGGATRVGAIVDHEGAILFVADGKGGFDLPWSSGLGTEDGSSGLRGTLRGLGLVADIGLLFSVFEDRRRGASAMSVVYRGTLAARPQISRSFKFIDHADVAAASVADKAVQAMLLRYVEERRNDVFGVYVGDSDSGKVQRLASFA